MNLFSASLHLPGLLAQSDSSSGGGGAVGAIAGLIFFVVYLAVLALVIAGMWKVFTKAGKPGWAAIVPVYNFVVLLEIAGLPIWYIVLLLIPFVNFIGLPFVLTMIGINIAKAFGKSGGFAAGLVLLAPVFYPILGFGDARYIGAGGRLAAPYPGGYPPATM